MTVTSLWCNFSGNVVANSNWSWLRVQTDCCQMEWKIQQDACITRLNNACMRTVCKWLKIWIPRKYYVWERCIKLFWNLHPKPKTVSELEITLEKIQDNFLHVQLT